MPVVPVVPVVVVVGVMPGGGLGKVAAAADGTGLLGRLPLPEMGPLHSQVPVNLLARVLTVRSQNRQAWGKPEEDQRTQPD